MVEEAAQADHELTAEKVGHHLVFAEIRHVHEIDAGPHFDELDGKVGRRPRRR
jgi:hypothetical protein